MQGKAVLWRQTADKMELNGQNGKPSIGRIYLYGNMHQASLSVNTEKES